MPSSGQALMSDTCARNKFPCTLNLAHQGVSVQDTQDANLGFSLFKMFVSLWPGCLDSLGINSIVSSEWGWYNLSLLSCRHKRTKLHTIMPLSLISATSILVSVRSKDSFVAVVCVPVFVLGHTQQFSGYTHVSVLGGHSWLHFKAWTWASHTQSMSCHSS